MSCNEALVLRQHGFRRHERTGCDKRQSHWAAAWTLLALLGLVCAAGVTDAVEIPIAGGTLTPITAPGVGYTNTGTFAWPMLVYLPANYSPTGPPYPLVFCLHGDGEVGNGSSDGTLTPSSTNQLCYMFGSGPMQLIHNGSTYFADQGVIVVQPQSDVGNGAAFDGTSGTINRVDLSMQYVLANYNIDHNRLYAMGLSAGAGGIIRYAYASATNPNYTLCTCIPIAQIQGIGSTFTNFSKFTKTITWIIGDCDDTTAYIILSAGRINEGVTGSTYGYGWEGGISTYLDQSINGGAVPPDSTKTRCLNTHPDYNAIVAGGYNAGNGSIPASEITNTATGYYTTANPVGWTWVQNETYTGGSMLQITVRKGGGHAGWNETFGQTTANLPFWNWLLAQRLGQTPTGYTGAYSVAITPVATTLSGAQSKTFTASVLDATGTPVSPQPAVTWSCLHGTISGAGVYTATASSGSDTITASTVVAAASYNSTAAVTLVAPTLAISPTSCTLTSSQTQSFSAVAKDFSGAALVPQPTITWSCLSGTISSAGLYTATASSGADTVTAHATTDGAAYTATAAVTLTSPTVTITPGSATLAAGQAQSFSAVVTTPAGTDLVPQPTITWSVVGVGGTISGGGLFTASALTGSVEVVATITGGFSRSAAVTLSTPTISLSPGAADLTSGQTLQYTATALNGSGVALVPQPTITWSCLGGSISSGGLYTATASSGSDTVTATATISGATYHAAGAITLSAPTISVAPTSATLAEAQTQAFTATVLGPGGTALVPQPAVTWSVVGAGGTVSSGGLFTATAASGSLQVVATLGSVAQSAAVTLATPQLVMTPGAATLTGTQSLQFTATAETSGGVALSPQPTITWSCSGGAISAAGLYTAGASSGSATVTASATITGASYHVAAAITLVAPTVGVSPATVSLAAAQTQLFTATVLGPGGVALAPQPAITWSVVGAGGTISGAGLFTATAANGSLQVVATVAATSFSHSAAVTLDTPTLSIAPSAATMTGGQGQAFSAIARDGSGAALSPQPTLTWSALHGSISPGGTYVAASSSGTDTVTASTSIGGLPYQSTCAITLVAPTIVLAPLSVTLARTQTQAFTVTVETPGGVALSPQPAISWSVVGGGGTVSATGVFTASATSGSLQVVATVGTTGFSQSAAVTLATPGLSITPDAATLTAGQTQAFTALATSSSGVALSPQPAISWSALHGTVSASGLYTATSSSGSDTLTATTTISGLPYQATASLTLVAPTLTLSPGSITLADSQTQQFTATALGPGGVALTPQPAITWSVVGAGGSVSASGLFTATASGSGSLQVVALITGTSVSASAAVTINTPNLALTPGVVTLTATQSEQFTATARDSGGTLLSPQPAITWSCVSGVISASGLYTASAASGSDTVTARATISGTAYQTTASVSLVAPTITLAPASATLALGQTQSYTATVLGPGGVALALQPAITWSVQGSGGAITPAGLFTASAASGALHVVATITATAQSQSAPVTLSTPSISMAPGTATLTAGATVGFSATVLSGAGVALSPQPAITWSCLSGVISGLGVYTATASSGTDTVTARATVAGLTYQSTAAITLVAPTIAMTPLTLTLADGQTQPFTATVLAPGGTPLAVQPVITWSLVGAGATLSSTGLLTATAGGLGSVQVVATIQGTAFSSSVPVTLDTPSLSLAPATVTLTTGESQLFVLVASDGGGAALAPQPVVTWSCLNGTVTSGGLYAATTTSGTDTLTAQATIGGLTYHTTAAITLVAPTLNLVPSSITLAQGQTQAFSVTVLGPGGVALAVQPAIVWSLVGSGGTLSSSGLFTATAAGSGALQVVATISGTSVSQSAAVTLSTPGLSISPATLSMTATQSQMFTAVATSGSGATLSPQPAITWTCSAGTITSAGLYTAAASSGAATITASTSVAGTAYQATAAIALVGPTLSVMPGSLQLAAGQSASFSASVLTPQGVALALQPTVLWSVVGSGGTITGAGLFTATAQQASLQVVATISGTSVTRSVTVTLDTPRVAVTPATVNLTSGQNTLLTAQVLDGSGAALSPQPAISWSCLTGTVTASGRYYATASTGTDTVTASATVSGVIYQSTMTVILLPPQIAVSPASLVLSDTQTQTFAAVVEGPGGQPLPQQPAITWSVVGAGGVVSPAGLFTATTAGSATLQVVATIFDTAYSQSATVTLNNPGLLMVPATVQLTSGETQLFQAIARDANNQIIAPQPVMTWSCLGGTIDATGLYTAVASSGSDTVTASCQIDSITVQVTAAVTLVAPTIVITPAGLTVNNGQVQQFSALVQSPGGTPLTVQPAITWTTQGAGGTITPAGLYTTGATSGSQGVVATISGTSFSQAVTILMTGDAMTQGGADAGATDGSGVAGGSGSGSGSTGAADAGSGAAASSGGSGGGGGCGLGGGAGLLALLALGRGRRSAAARRDTAPAP